MCTSLRVPDYEVLLNECVMLGVYPDSTNANKSPIYSGKASGINSNPYGTPTSPNEPVSTWLPSPTACTAQQFDLSSPSSDVSSSGEQSPNPNNNTNNYSRTNSFVCNNNNGSGRQTPTAATADQESSRQRNSIFNLNPLASENDTAMESNLFNVLSPENTEAMSPATSYQQSYSPLLSCLSNDSSDNDEEQQFCLKSSSSNSSNEFDRRLSMMNFAPSPQLVSEMVSNYKQQQQQQLQRQNSNINITNEGKMINKPKRKTRLCKLTTSEKSERRKKQNRLAASRCRKKKQAALSNMEDTANGMKEENDKLRVEMDEMKKVIADLQQKLQQQSSQHSSSSFSCPRKCCRQT